jgi:dipeptidyl aminopeptidase/acylaminoacyl peptidase
MTQTFRVYFALLALILFAPQPMSAQPRARVLDDTTFMDMERVSGPAIAPDGKQIVFTRGWIDKMRDQSRSNLWIVDSEGSRVRELTNGAWRDSDAVWAPDSQRVAFLSDRGGSNQLHVLWVGSGEVAQLTHLQRAPSGIRWSPDGRWIAFTSVVPDEDPILAIKLPARPRGAEWARGATVVDRGSWARDGVGQVEKGFTQVFVIDARLGGTPRQITEGKYNHSNPEWSADGATIYVSGIRKPDAEFLRGDSEIYAVDVKTLAVKTLTNRGGPDDNPAVSPDGKRIAYTGHDEKNFTRHVSHLYLMNADGSGSRLWAGNLADSPGELTWAPDNSGIYYTVGERGVDNIYFVPVTGAPRKLTNDVQTLGGLSIARTGQVATVRSTFHQPGHLVTFPLTNPASVKTLVDVNSDVLEGVRLGEVEELWFTAKDGVKAQGWLVKPVDFDPKKKYPMVLWIHGGPWSMYNVGFNWGYQNFAAKGYAVLYTNPRGSTGYGQEFVNGIQYSYPGKDYDDLMAGVDAAIAKGFIDERNLFVCGGSGGGVLTAWIVGHTNRFAAAVSMRPVINWHSFVGTTDGVGWYRQFEKYPWEDPTDYVKRSPLTYVGNVTTPTMLMTGEEDLRTPMGQSEEFYRALKMLKKETLLVRMPDEFHGWRRPSRQLSQQLYLQAWFEKHRRPSATTTTSQGPQGQ